MRKPTSRTATVLVDYREKQPWLFPPHLDLHLGANSVLRYTLKVPSPRPKLAAGDYCLAGDEGGVGVERKKGVAELFGNLKTRDRPRFLEALDKLAGTYDRPVLAIEESLADFTRSRTGYLASDRIRVDGEAVLSALLVECHQRDIHVMFLGSCTSPVRKRQVGANMVRLMLIDRLFRSGNLP